MMDHNDERQKQEHWSHCQHNIVNYIRDHLKLDFTPDEINHVIGLIEVNAFEVKLVKTNNEGDIIQQGVKNVNILGKALKSC